MANNKSNGMIFLFLFPIFILLFSFLFDIALIKVQEKRVEKITKEIMTEVLTTNVDDYYLRIKTLYEKKEISTNQLSVKYQNGYVYIYNVHTYTAFFGKVLSIDNYRIETSVRGYLDNSKVVVENVDRDEVD